MKSRSVPSFPVPHPPPCHHNHHNFGGIEHGTSADQNDKVFDVTSRQSDQVILFWQVNYFLTD